MTTQGCRPVKERRRALVTGGAIRVGRSIALALAAAGHDVAIGYHRSAAAAGRTSADLERLGARTTAIGVDLARPGGARRLVARAAAALGGLDIVVNNAAVFFRTPFASVTPAVYDRFLDVNLRAAFFCAQAAAPLMTGGGHIVNIADVGAGRAWPGYIPYTVSKAGLIALTRSLAAALRGQRIAVNCVAPGAVLRPARFPLARWKAVTRGNTASVDDVLAAVMFFATCPPSITGQVLHADGGDIA